MASTARLVIPLLFSARFSTRSPTSRCSVPCVLSTQYIGGRDAASTRTRAAELALKVMRSVRPETRASTTFCPGTLPRVRRVWARPFEPVRLLVDERVPPPETTLNVTVIPESGSSSSSITSTTKGLASLAPGAPL